MSSNLSRWLRLVPRPARPGRVLAVLAAGTLAGAALAAVHMGATPALAAPTTVTFAFTGASQSFTVPAGITSLTVDAFGAQGGHGADQPGGSGGAGGLGGRATATLAVTPGQVLQVNVGGAGGDSSGNIDNGSAGGFGGGGSSTPGGGGGGASDVRSGGFTLGERLLVAGGGGGGAAATSAAGAAGGAGGGISGGAGANGAPSGDGSVAGGGGGGTASAGGSGGSSSVGLFAGQPGAGGAGGTGNSGGGGGWFGGGGGAGSATFGGGDGGGGGGSGFGPTGTVFATGVQAGNGVVTITYAPLPVVTAISPSSGPQTGGTSVTITGAGFAGATAVSFGTTTATSFTVVNDSTITAIAPAANAVGTVDVTVTTSGGTSATSSADQYTYVYPFGGFLAPVASPPTVNMVHAGQAVPLQFQLGGNRGLNVLATRFPQGQRVRCTSGAPINTATETMTAGGSGLQFDPTTNTYTYVWKTPRAASGTCVVFILGLNDGTVHTANFQFA